MLTVMIKRNLEKMKRQRTQIRDEVNKILDREVVDVDINRHTSQENRAYFRGQNRSITLDTQASTYGDNQKNIYKNRQR